MTTLKPASQRVVAAAATLGVHIEITTFPAGTRTAADAAAAIGCDVAAIAKSMVVMADDEPVLVLTSGINRVDHGRVAALLGAVAVRQATPAEVRTATGFAIGGTAPFGHPGPVRVLADADLSTLQTVWAAGGTPDTVFEIDTRTLLRATGATVADVAEGPVRRDR